MAVSIVTPNNFKSLNPYSPGINFNTIAHLIEELCIFAQLDGWHDHKRFQTIVALINAYVPDVCKDQCDAREGLVGGYARKYVSEEAYFESYVESPSKSNV